MNVWERKVALTENLPLPWLYLLELERYMNLQQRFLNTSQRQKRKRTEKWKGKNNKNRAAQATFCYGGFTDSLDFWYVGFDRDFSIFVMCDRKAVTSHEFVCTIFVMCNGNGNDNGSHITLHARFLLCAMAVASHNFVCTIFAIFVMCNGCGVT